MRYSDGLRAHARYQSTAKSAINVRRISLRPLLSLTCPIQIYLRLHDDPNSVAKPVLTNGASLAAKEEKKAENKAKKLDKGKKGESLVLVCSTLLTSSLQLQRRLTMMSMSLRLSSIWIRSERHFSKRRLRSTLRSNG